MVLFTVINEDLIDENDIFTNKKIIQLVDCGQVKTGPSEVQLINTFSIKHGIEDSCW